MINQAVSDEVDTNYVERSSPLGQQIYGLRLEDLFTFRDGNKVYRGSAEAVELAQQSQQETMGYQYHKQRVEILSFFVKIMYNYNEI